MGALRKQMDGNLVVRGMSVRTREAYLGAVAVVDAKHQVVVHARAFGEAQEHGLLVPMLEGARANFRTIAEQADVLRRVKPAATVSSSWSLRTVFLSCTFPNPSTPCSAKSFFARSIPAVVTCAMTSPLSVELDNLPRSEVVVGKPDRVRQPGRGSPDGARGCRPRSALRVPVHGSHTTRTRGIVQCCGAR